MWKRKKTEITPVEDGETGASRIMQRFAKKQDSGELATSGTFVATCNTYPGRATIWHGRIENGLATFDRKKKLKLQDNEVSDFAPAAPKRQNLKYVFEAPCSCAWCKNDNVVICNCGENSCHMAGTDHQCPSCGVYAKAQDILKAESLAAERSAPVSRLPSQGRKALPSPKRGLLGFRR